MKQVLAFRLEEGETLCSLIGDCRHLGLHLMAHTELPNGLHIFEDREPAVIELPAVKLTATERLNWDSTVRANHSRKSFYQMRGTVDPDTDIFPFPPIIKFIVDGVEIEISVRYVTNNGGGDSLHMTYKGELIATTGSTMGKWSLRNAGFKEYVEDPAMVKAAITAIKFLDEKLYDEEESEEEEAA